MSKSRFAHRRARMCEISETGSRETASTTIGPFGKISETYRLFGPA